jgi:mono/diheme cytochrome c family protein
VRRASILWLTCVALASGPLPSGAEPAEGAAAGGQPLLAELGAGLYREHCAACHGPLGRGDGPAASSLRVPPADLTLIAVRRGGAFPDADVAAFIDGRFELGAHGTREMPIWGRRLAEPIAAGTEGDEVARGRIQILVEYLKTIQQPSP